jgi:hypothetical protein
MLTKVLAALTIAGSLCLATVAGWYGVQSLRTDTPVPTSGGCTSCCEEPSCCDEPVGGCCEDATTPAKKSCCDE